MRNQMLSVTTMLALLLPASSAWGSSGGTVNFTPLGTRSQFTPSFVKLFDGVDAPSSEVLVTVSGSFNILNSSLVPTSGHALFELVYGIDSACNPNTNTDSTLYEFQSASPNVSQLQPVSLSAVISPFAGCPISVFAAFADGTPGATSGPALNWTQFTKWTMSAVAIYGGGGNTLMVGPDPNGDIGWATFTLGNMCLGGTCVSNSDNSLQLAPYEFGYQYPLTNVTIPQGRTAPTLVTVSGSFCVLNSSNAPVSGGVSFQLSYPATGGYVTSSVVHTAVSATGWHEPITFSESLPITSTGPVWVLILPLDGATIGFDIDDTWNLTTAPFTESSGVVWSPAGDTYSSSTDDMIDMNDSSAGYLSVAPSGTGGALVEVSASFEEQAIACTISSCPGSSCSCGTGSSGASCVFSGGGDVCGHVDYFPRTSFDVMFCTSKAYSALLHRYMCTNWQSTTAYIPYINSAEAIGDRAKLSFSFFLANPLQGWPMYVQWQAPAANQDELAPTLPYTGGPDQWSVTISQ